MQDADQFAAPQPVSEKSRSGNHGSVIRVTRPTSFVDALRAYRIIVDGVESARINSGKTVDVPVNPGSHSVVAKVDWCGSQTVCLDVDAGDTIHLECANNSRGNRFIHIMFRHDQYLTLAEL
jgi:hypothetical protein